MKIIKRNGTEVEKDVKKIITAIKKANAEVSEEKKLSNDEILRISNEVDEQIEAVGRAVHVEEIQDMVEMAIMSYHKYELARKYITYRYKQSMLRQVNTTDEQILSLIECDNEEVKQENSNKNPTINSVQRDYMAGEVSKDLTKRFFG